MEGVRRGLPPRAWLRRGRPATIAATAAAVCAMGLALGACSGDDSSGLGPSALRTAHPERTFAPLLEVAADEPWRPTSARRFIERAAIHRGRGVVVRRGR